jgi:hypothetical protein
MHPKGIGNVAKERFSYPLRVGLARWGKQVWAAKNGGTPCPSFRGARQREPGISFNYLGIPGSWLRHDPE